MRPGSTPDAISRSRDSASRTERCDAASHTPRTIRRASGDSNGPNPTPASANGLPVSAARAAGPA